jgi:parallel beta-helix repeat protein
VKYPLIATTLVGLVLTVSTSSADVLNVPNDFDRIEDAVDAASPGDVIEVESGVYTDRTEIREASSLTIQGVDTGAGQPIIRPEAGEDGFRLRESTDIVITGFRFEGGERGVRIRDVSNNVEVVANEFDGVEIAVRIREGSGHIVVGNDIRNSSLGGGVRVREATNVQIDGNTLANLADDGIRVRESSNVTLTGNDISDIIGDGIDVRESSNVVIGNLSLGGNSSSDNAENGIRVKESTGVSIEENVTNDNLRYGIRVKETSPIDEIADLTAANNSAECNAFGDFRVGSEVFSNDCASGSTTSTSTSSTSTTSTTLP